MTDGADDMSGALTELATASRILALHGHEDLTLGHVALRDPRGRGFWMKKRSLGLGEVREATDFLLLDWEGKILFGDEHSHSEWPLHSEVFLARSDLNVSVHSHPECASTLSASSAPIPSITQDAMRVNNEGVARFDASADLVTTREGGKLVAEALGDASIVILRNHGVSIFAETAPRLALMGVILERAARAVLRLAASGLDFSAPDREDVPKVLAAMRSERFVADNWAFLKRQLRSRERGVGG